MGGHMTIRFAAEADAARVLSFIRALAAYERLLDCVVATEEILREWLFGRKMAEVLFVCEDGEEVGFALFFPNFSTFLGRPGLYLEDLFVLPAYRGRGYGRALLRKLAQLVIERGYGRLEWQVLDWNAPGIAFYESLGALPRDEWTPYRLAGDALENLAGEAPRGL